MRFISLSSFLIFVWAAVAVAAPQFPPLTGRVVDQAHLLSPSTIVSLEQELDNYESRTSNQVVVVTVLSLNGYSIEDYSYQLGRYWQIGQKGKDNGVLLIVAPQERKVRIEVGYGLEPILTDAVASTIVHNIILPSFSTGYMEKGIIDGTHAILSVLGGKELPADHQNADQPSVLQIFFLLLVIYFFFRFSLRHPFIAAYLLSSRSSRFGGSNWSSFRGGGGSFGGGGSSGSW